jgi:hypothetical protein
VPLRWSISSNIWWANEPLGRGEPPHISRALRVGVVNLLTLGVSTCFILNAASYFAVIVALSRMRAADLYPTPGVGRSKGQVREGMRYVWSTPDLRSPLISMAIVGVFAFNFTVTLPLFSKVTVHGGAGLYSAFLVAMVPARWSAGSSPPIAAARPPTCWP